MTVYAVHSLKELDVTPAQVYGEISYINPRYIYADEVVDHEIPPAFMSRMERVVDRFDPEEDFLLIGGDHLQLIAMSALLSARWEGFSVLRYDREAKGYLRFDIRAPIDDPK